MSKGYADLEEKCINCKICGIKPKVDGYYSSVYERLVATVICPVCNHKVTSSTDVYDFDTMQPNAQQIIHQMWEDTYQQAIDKWNNQMKA